MPDVPVSKRKPVVLLVGHCGPDASMLRAALRSALPDVSLESVNDGRRLEALVGSADLALVNRALDGEFEAADGIELIRKLGVNVGPGKGPVLMLVSNYPEAQAAASAAGAAPGFGKSDLYSPQTRAILLRALGRSDSV